MGVWRPAACVGTERASVLGLAELACLIQDWSCEARLPETKSSSEGEGWGRPKEAPSLRERRSGIRRRPGVSCEGMPTYRDQARYSRVHEHYSRLGSHPRR